MSAALPTDEQLLAAAEAALSRAHGRYSGVRVAAAALDASGAVHVGVNVENSSLGLTICAERNALTRAVAEGAALDRVGREIVALVFASNNPRVAVPCGACRQVIRELAPAARIAYGAAGKMLRRWNSIHDLLPDAFDDSWTGGEDA